MTTWALIAGGPAAKLASFRGRKWPVPYLFFTSHTLPPPDPPVLEPGFRMEIWRPSTLQPLRWELLAVPFVAWSLFHFLGIFANRDYFLLLIFQGAKLVHRTCVIPPHFKFPFMGAMDLQAAGIWTHPAMRGRGLGLLAVQEVLRRIETPGRTLWYLTREENSASIRLAEKAGLVLAARGRRRHRLGLRVLGRFHLDEVIEPAPRDPGLGHTEGIPTQG